MNTMLLTLVVAPHLALGIAWAFWVRSPSRIQPPKWRAILLLSGLLAASLKHRDFLGVLDLAALSSGGPVVVEGRDYLEGVSDFLAGYVFLAAIFGRGRGRVSLAVAALAGYLLWVTGHSVL